MNIWGDQQVFRTIFEAIPSGLALVNAQGRISHWNPAAESMTGLARRQVIGRSCSAVFHCPNSAKRCPLALARNGAVPSLCTEVQLNTAGRAILLQKTSAYINDADGHIIGAIESFVDLTQEREAQAALHEARELVESARQAKRHFMANMSHEIRTPINGILGLIELLADSEETTPSQRDHLAGVRRSADLLKNLIDDILDFTIIDKGAVNVESTGFSLRSVIASVIARQHDLTQNRAVFIHSHVQDDVPDNVIGDSGHLYQILKHLVGNAIKFTPAGEVGVRVARAPSPGAGDQRRLPLHFSISDTGVGIPQDKLTHIFESLSQVDESPTRAFGGLGIGLNIVHRLVTLLEGVIWIESQSGQGTTVHFQLPFRGMLNDDGDIDADGPPFPVQTADAGNSRRGHTLATGQAVAAAVPPQRPSPTAFTQDKFRHMQALLDQDPHAAELWIMELRAEAQSADQTELSRQLFRLLLALRRGDAESIERYRRHFENSSTCVGSRPAAANP